MADDKRTVYLVAGTWPPTDCGIAPYNRSLARGLEAAGFKVRVVANDEAREDPDIMLMRVESWSPREVLRLIGLLRRSSAGIVHLQHPTRATRLRSAVYLIPSLVRLFARQHRVVTTFHYLRPFDLRTAMLRVFFLLPALFSDAIVVTTDWEAAYARKFLSNTKILVVPAGLTEELKRSDQAQREQTRRKLGFDTGDFVVAFFGYLLPNKGLQTLLQALPKLSERTKLLVIGDSYAANDRYPIQLQEVARQLGIAGRVRWMGKVDAQSIGSLLSAADCAALPYDEGASLKRSTLLAALAVNLPAVTTLGPEVDGVMKNGENLLLVGPRDSGALADALMRLESEPGLGPSLTAAAAPILDSVDWNRIVDLHVGLYDGL